MSNKTQKERLLLIEKNLIKLIKETNHYSALNRLTAGLCEIKQCFGYLEGNNFYGYDKDNKKYE